MPTKNSDDTIGNRTRDLPTCSLNQLRHRVPPVSAVNVIQNYIKKQQKALDMMHLYRNIIQF